jgi:hypothetical protein
MANAKSPKHDPKIGNETIYPAQWEVADIVEQVLRKGRVPIVLFQFQGGKTGVMLAITKTFIDSCKARNKTFQVFSLCGIDSLDLAKQTRKRFTRGRNSDEGKTLFGAQLDELAKSTNLDLYPEEFENLGVVVLHNNTTLKKIDLSSVRPDERLILIDEAHIGLVKDGTIDTFLRNCGVYLSEQTHQWDSTTKNLVVPVSATPFAHLTLSRQFTGGDSWNSLFEVVYKDPGPNYNSPEKMLENGRLRQVKRLFCDGEPTDFLESVISEFYLACKKEGPGHLVIRVTGDRYADMLRYIHADGTIDFKSFNKDHENIDELNDFLSRRPSKPMLVLIKGAMRAGITLKANYIRSWVETQSKQCDTQTQAGIGRACGYNRKETYPIYCDLTAAKKIVKCFKELREGQVKHIPAGRQNHAVSSEDVGTTPRKTVEVLIMSKEQADELKDKLTVAAGYAPKPGSGKTSVYQITSTAGQNVMMKAGLVLRGQMDTSKRKDGVYVTLGYHLNGPGKHKDPVKNRQQRRDYNNLIKAHPTWKDKVVVLLELVGDHPEWTLDFERDLLEVQPLKDKPILGYHKVTSALRKDVKGSKKGGV